MVLGRLLDETKTGSDFAVLNKMLSSVTFSIPDQSFVAGKVISNIYVTMSNIRCGDAQIGDLAVSSIFSTVSSVDLTMDADLSSIACTADWAYTWGIFKGSGSVKTSGHGGLVSVVAFDSDNFHTLPPTSSTMKSCTANLDISDLVFTGGITADIANLFKTKIESTIEDKVAPLLCTELGTFGSGFLTSSLKNVSSLLSPYLLSRSIVDPLAEEQHLDLNATLADRLISFNQSELIADVRGLIVEKLGRRDPTTNELAINKLLQKIFPSG